MMPLPEPWSQIYAERQDAIRTRLQDFASVQPEDYFYELAYCLLTPQSSARNADMTIDELRRDDFVKHGFDPTPYLRDPRHYVRFHNVKSARLLRVREQWDSLLPLLTKRGDAKMLRDIMLEAVPGFGMKEASHFLRNIGVLGLAILDRHIFKHLAHLGVIPEIPKNAPTRKRYLDIEDAWHAYAREVGISLDELDLLFWSMETGEIRK
ncbi:MAG TPA: DNA lyase [Candidatus Kapabacteria bacterium]|nr:DNA lyase [Candidatus Kapabacteria bacterium]